MGKANAVDQAPGLPCSDLSFANGHSSVTTCGDGKEEIVATDSDDSGVSDKLSSDPIETPGTALDSPRAIPQFVRGTFYYSCVEQLEHVNCQVCQRGDGEERMLLCDGCNKGFHFDCLSPPLNRVPKGDWTCEVCTFIYDLDEKPRQGKEKKSANSEGVHPNPEWARKSSKPGIALGDLPDEVIVCICVHLTAKQCLSVASRVSKSWTIASGRSHVWLGLGILHGLSMPRSASKGRCAGRHTRAETDVRRAFWQAKRGKEAAQRERTEQVLGASMRAMGRGELKERQLAQLAEVPADAGFAMHDNWTAAHMAAFYGRIATLQALVTLHGASLAVEDDGGLTPLGIAAWSGEGKVVEWILGSGRDYGSLFRKGEPSSRSVLRRSRSAQAKGRAGGRGRQCQLTPYGLAQQSGGAGIARLIEGQVLRGLERATSGDAARWVHADAGLSPRSTEYALDLRRRQLDGAFLVGCSAETLVGMGWDAADAQLVCTKLKARHLLPTTLDKARRPPHTTPDKTIPRPAPDSTSEHPAAARTLRMEAPPSSSALRVTASLPACPPGGFAYPKTMAFAFPPPQLSPHTLSTPPQKLSTPLPTPFQTHTTPPQTFSTPPQTFSTPPQTLPGPTPQPAPFAPPAFPFPGSAFPFPSQSLLFRAQALHLTQALLAPSSPSRRACHSPSVYRCSLCKGRGHTRPRCPQAAGSAPPRPTTAPRPPQSLPGSLATIDAVSAVLGEAAPTAEVGFGAAAAAAAERSMVPVETASGMGPDGAASVEAWEAGAEAVDESALAARLGAELLSCFD